MHKEPKPHIFIPLLILPRRDDEGCSLNSEQYYARLLSYRIFPYTSKRSVSDRRTFPEEGNDDVDDDVGKRWLNWRVI